MKIEEILFKAHNITGEARECIDCGSRFWAHRYKIKQGKARFCSRVCANKAQVGKRHSPNTEFKAGHKPLARSYLQGDSHPNWLGKIVGYFALHEWVRRKKGTPSKCERCHLDDPTRRYEWANVDRKYRRNLNDFIRLCKSCHTKHDNLLIQSICG